MRKLIMRLFEARAKMFIRKCPTANLLFVAAILMCSGCSGVNLKESSAFSSPKSYNLAYSNQNFDDQKMTFSAIHDLLTITGYKEVSVIDLKNNSVLKTIPSPDSKITNSQFFDSGKRFLLATDESLQVWDTSNWQLIKQMNATQISKLSGTSSDSKYLYFDGAIWLTSNYQKFMVIDKEPSPSSFNFSNSNKFFVIAGHYSGAIIIDLENGEFVAKEKSQKGVTKISFINDDSFYASYDAKLEIENGGYLANKLGLFDVTNNKIIHDYSPPSRITCWVNDPESGLLVSLYNGDIVFMNHQFDTTNKWHIDSPINVCTQAKDKDIWLGSEESGVYKLDLKKKGLSHEYKTENPISDLKLSPDNRYFGFVELIPGGTISKVFHFKTSE